MEKVGSIVTSCANADIIWNLAWRPNFNEIYYTLKNEILFFSFDFDGENEFSKKHKMLENRHKKAVRSINFSNEGNLLLCSSFDGSCTLYKYDVGEWKHAQTLQGHENEVKCVCIDNTNKYIATCGRDKTIWIYEKSTYKRETEEDNDLFYCSSMLVGHTQDIKYVTWHPKDELLASCSYDNSIKLWSKGEDWYCKQTLDSHTSTVWCICFNCDGNFLCSASQDKSLKIFKKNPEDSLYILSFSFDDLHEFGIYHVKFHPFYDIIATGGADNKIVIIEKTSEGVWYIADKMEYAHNGDVNCVSWAPHYRGDGECVYLCSSGDDGIINIYKYNP